MIGYLVDLLFQVYILLLFVRIVASWVPDLQRYRIMHFVAFYTDPYLNLFRRIIPPLGAMDFSPIIALFVLSIVKNAILNLLS